MYDAATTRSYLITQVLNEQKKVNDPNCDACENMMKNN
jgi:hypothetical protein